MKKYITRFFLWIKNNTSLTILIILTAVIHFSIILPSGSHYCFNGFCGDYYWGVQEHDGIWHIAVAETAFRNGFPINPSFSGTSLSGYNILLDYIIYFLSKLGLSSFFVYFKIFPLFWFILFTYTAIRFIRLFSKDKLTLFIFFLLSYFGTSFGFLVPLIKEHNFEGITAMTIMQPILTLTNLQLAFSYITMMWVVITMLEFKRDVYKVIFISIFLFLSWGLKFYAGFLVSIIVGLYYLIVAIKNKNYLYFLWIVIFFTASLSAIIFIYNPFLSIHSSGSAFAVQPLALIWPYIEDTGSFFYSSYWANAKYIFLNSPKVSPRFLLFETLLIFIYLFSNFGMRVVGFFYIVKNKLKTIDITIFISIAAGVFASLLFIQKGVWWNVVQFLYISSFLLNIYTALYISKLKNKLFKLIFLFLIIVTAIPYMFDSIRPYISKGYNYVSDNEKRALSVLKKNKGGVVYNPLFNNNSPKNSDVNELRLVSDNSYISAYTGQQMYLQVTGAILLSNDYQRREGLIKRGNCVIVQEINYVYFNSDSTDLFIRKCILKNTTFSKTYSDGGYFIYSKKD